MLHFVTLCEIFLILSEYFDYHVCINNVEYASTFFQVEATRETLTHLFPDEESVFHHQGARPKKPIIGILMHLKIVHH